MSTDDLQTALVDLQMRVAHQDDTLLKLNDAIAQQQRDLLQLNRSMQELAQQLRSLRDANPTGESGGQQQHELPPHY